MLSPLLSLGENRGVPKKAKGGCFFGKIIEDRHAKIKVAPKARLNPRVLCPPLYLRQSKTLKTSHGKEKLK